jgi:hypothetical protein
VNIDISPNGNTVEIKGSSRELVVAAKAALEKRIKQLHAERWETTAPTECMPALIGKQGANINKLRADTGAGIDIEGSTIKVHASVILVARTSALLIVNFITFTGVWFRGEGGSRKSGHFGDSWRGPSEAGGIQDTGRPRCQHPRHHWGEGGYGARAAGGDGCALRL